MEHRIVIAPMAGGPTTPTLVAAGAEAGALAFLAAGYRSGRDLEGEIAAVRAATSRPFGVNLFVPTPDDADASAVAAYAECLRESEQSELGEPRWSDDDWDAKLEVVARERPAVVSFTFGCPPAQTIEELRTLGVSAWCTVTSVQEAALAEEAGADALVVQGGEAGGHQGSYADADGERTPMLELVAEVAGRSSLPIVAAGGIATRDLVRAALAVGAVAAQIGTAFMLAPEAGTSAPHRAAFAGDAPTALTRAFSGRRARGIVNRFMEEHDAHAPHAYPNVHYLTAPLRAAARAAGDAGSINLWAGTAYREARGEPVAAIVARLTP